MLNRSFSCTHPISISALSNNINRRFILTHGELFGLLLLFISFVVIDQKDRRMARLTGQLEWLES